jgi:phosphatidylserine/phosphatidylglycerophosphate/cardiolipin synthase-like enzyme
VKRFHTPPKLAGSVSPAAPDATLLERLPEALRRDAEHEGTSTAPPALLPYPRLPDSMLQPRMVSGRLMAYASPDSTYAVTKRLIDSAQSSIVIGIYDFHADYMKELLKKAMKRGVSVSLMLDTNSADESSVFDELTELGAHCVRAPSQSAGNPIAFFGNAHEKIIAIDGEIVMIQSGNWSENSIPFNEGDGVVIGAFEQGNRDMGIAVHSPDLAQFFAELVARDMRLAQGLPPDVPPATIVATPVTSRASELFFEAAPPDVPVSLFQSLTVTPSAPVAVTPVITPENFHGVAKDFLGAAKHSIRIEQQYIRGGQENVEALLKEIAKAREDHPELIVRIIVSPKFLTGANRERFFKAMSDFHFDFDEHFRFLSPDHFVHCHNKLIVVDDERVLLGSQNWSTTGLLTNREASLLVDHSGIASYFAGIFDADWTMSEPVPAPPGTVPGLAAAAIADPLDFAKGGVVISAVRDYTDV